MKLFQPKKKVAVLDFDGTLSNKYISMEFIEFLHKHNIFLYNQGVYENQKRALNDFLNGKITYEEWVKHWACLWVEGIRFNLKRTMNQMALQFFSEFKKNIYPSSYELVKVLKSRGYYVVLLSVGAYEVVSLAGQELKVDEIIATRCQIEKKHPGKKIYTGKLLTDLHLPGGKKGAVKKIFKKKEFSKKESLAAGDSESDSEILEMVKIPIALNPRPKLKTLAEKKRWRIANHKSILLMIKN